MLNFQGIPNDNLFSETDHLIVRQAMALLSKRQLKAITLRYWENLSEPEIAIAMNTDWQTVDRLITGAYQRLKEICLSQPDFSRNQKIEIPATQKIARKNPRKNKCKAEVSSYGN